MIVCEERSMTAGKEVVRMDIMGVDFFKRDLST